MCRPTGRRAAALGCGPGQRWSLRQHGSTAACVQAVARCHAHHVLSDALKAALRYRSHECTEPMQLFSAAAVGFCCLFVCFVVVAVVAFSIFVLFCCLLLFGCFLSFLFCLSFMVAMLFLRGFVCASMKGTAKSGI